MTNLIKWPIVISAGLGFLLMMLAYNMFVEQKITPAGEVKDSFRGIRSRRAA